jgi:hypothetical protein
MKVIYICHPVSNDVAGNLEKIKAIAREINLTEANVCPIAPYTLELSCLSDSDRFERNRGVRNGIELIERKIFDELWLFGDFISPGMRFEIMKCNELGIPVVPKSAEIKKLFLDKLNQLKQAA